MMEKNRIKSNNFMQRKPIDEKQDIPKKQDILLDMCINQGYVPKTCTLDGRIVIGLTTSQGDACKGCNEDRKICKGRIK